MRPASSRPAVWTPKPGLHRGSLMDRLERRRSAGLLPDGPVATVRRSDLAMPAPAAAKRRGGKHRNLKKVLVTSIVVATLGTLASGTFASFTAKSGS